MFYSNSTLFGGCIWGRFVFFFRILLHPSWSFHETKKKMQIFMIPRKKIGSSNKIYIVTRNLVTKIFNILGHFKSEKFISYSSASKLKNLKFVTLPDLMTISASKFHFWSLFVKRKVVSNFLTAVFLKTKVVSMNITAVFVVFFRNVSRAENCCFLENLP